MTKKRIRNWAHCFNRVWLDSMKMAKLNIETINETIESRCCAGNYCHSATNSISSHSFSVYWRPASETVVTSIRIPPHIIITVREQNNNTSIKKSHRRIIRLVPLNTREHFKHSGDLCADHLSLSFWKKKRIGTKNHVRHSIGIHALLWKSQHKFYWTLRCKTIKIKMESRKMGLTTRK